MTYVTGQPIVFVGCGQVCIEPRFYSHCPLTEESYLDVHRSETAESGECCGGDLERLIRVGFAHGVLSQSLLQSLLPEAQMESRRSLHHEYPSSMCRSRGIK